jgi:cystathionine beta-lyase
MLKNMAKLSDGNNWGDATRCIHAGGIEDDKYKGVVTPIYVSTAYDYLGVPENAYPRYFNTPNMQSLNEKLAALEHGRDALVFGSGMAAIHATLFSLLSPGDHAIFQNDLYGGTHHAITAEMGRMNMEFTFVEDMTRDSIKSAIRPNTRLIYIETPSNPLLKITDIPLVVEIAKTHSLISVIDNTFASPINQNPIQLGMDVVIHSGTKYLGGHSDILSGAVISSEKLIETIRQSAINFGGNLNAHMCHLLERSLLTLALRVRQINTNAMNLAVFLQEHKDVNHVYYPGLSTHPDHELASKQMKGFGGMLSFEVKDDPDVMVKRLKLARSAMSLGGVETTVSSPRLTSHAKIGPEGRKKVGISDRLLRVSVGIEDIEDLIADFDQALSS